MNSMAISAQAGTRTRIGAVRSWPEWGVLVVYSALIAFMIPYHEPWADEAQAWLLARDLSPWQLLHTNLRYEGSPAIWHLLLWVLIRLRVSYTGMHWISGLIAIGGIYLLLFLSPFPRWLKLSLPFTVFFAFQYAIVARSYVLVPILVFAVAAAWRRNAVVVALLLGLLANVTAHGAAIAAGFGIAYLVERYVRRRRGEPVSSPAHFRIAVVIFVSLGIIAVLTAFPTPDVKNANPPHRDFIGSGLMALLFGMWQPMELGIIGWGLMIWGLTRRRVPHLLIPALVLVLFSAAVYVTYWHAGLLVVVMTAVLWISWPRETAPLHAAEIAMQCAVAVLIATQVGWTVHAAWYDHFHDYSPGKRTAAFLAPYVRAGVPIAVTYGKGTSYHVVGIQPYFPRNIFVNQPNSFYFWSRSNHVAADFPATLAEHPGIILVEGQVYNASAAEDGADLSDPALASSLRSIEEHGYRRDRIFCAIKPERFAYRESVCFFVMMSITLQPPLIDSPDRHSAGKHPPPGDPHTNKIGNGTLGHVLTRAGVRPINRDTPFKD